MQLGSLGKASFEAAKSLTAQGQLQKQMGLPKTQQEMFVVFLGNTLEENKGLFLLNLTSQFWQ